MFEPFFVFIILNYNGERHLSYCLPTLCQMRYSNYKIVVVDNGSTDGSIALMKGCFPDVVIIETKKYLGYADGNNVGIEYAKRLRAEFVVLLNNDTRVHPDFLRAMASFASVHPKAGIFAGKYYFMRTHTFQVAGGGYFTKEEKGGKNIGPNEKDGGQYDEPIKIDYVYAAAFVVRTSLFERIGLLDPLWQFGYEGPDLCKRAAKFSIESWYVPEAKVEHEVGGTMNRKKRQTQTNINFRVARAARNRFRFLLKHYPLQQAYVAESWYALRSLKDVSLKLWTPFLELYSIAWNFLHLSQTFTLKNLGREDYENVYTKLLNCCSVFDAREVVNQRGFLGELEIVPM
jgi:GT2 family glycosyltransferase